MNLNENVGDTMQCQWVSDVEESFHVERFPVSRFNLLDVAHGWSGLIEPRMICRRGFYEEFDEMEWSFPLYMYVVIMDIGLADESLFCPKEKHIQPLLPVVSACCDQFIIR